MGWRNALKEARNWKPVFVATYGSVVIRILVSSFYVFSAIHSSSPNSTSSFSSSSLFGDEAESAPAPAPSNFYGPTTTVNTVKAAVATPMAETRTPSSGRGVRPIWEAPPRTKKMPPLKSFRLTKELVQQRVKDNVIIVTFRNFAFVDFILTWVKHLTDLHLSNILVGAMDTKLLEALYWEGIPVFDMGSHTSIIDVGWGSPKFHKMGREKVILIDSILPYGFELLMCDQIWFLKNPLPYLARYPGADVLTSSDSVVPTVVDDSLDIWQQVGAAYNIGIFHWRPTDSAKKLAKEWKEILMVDEKIWDQNGFHDLVRQQLGPSVDKESGLVYA